MTALAQHAHSVMHCNLNTVDLNASEPFYTELLGLESRMRSVSTGSDATVMGLGDHTESVTVFLYDQRGPRAAAALELVGWSEPATEPLDLDPDGLGFAAIGFRVPDVGPVRAALEKLGQPVLEVPDGLMVRGERRPGIRVVDRDGVLVEIVAIAPSTTDPDVGVISHERLRCSDLKASVDWYAGIGFNVRARGEGWAAVFLPEDPTFSFELEQSVLPAVPVPRVANTQGLYRIALAVDDVREAHAGLVATGQQGVPDPEFISMPDVPTGGFTVLFLRDPDDVVVELVERPRSAVRRPLEPC